MMKWFILLLVSVQCQLAYAHPTLRALLIGNTTSTDMKTSSQADIKRMKKSLQGIAEQACLHLQLSIFNGKVVTAQNVANWIDVLPNSTDDIVFLYYSGRGITLSSSVWPAVELSCGPNMRPSVVSADIFSAVIQTHKPKLTIVFLDCYNHFVSPVNPINSLPDTIIEKKPHLPGIKKLFRKKGVVLIASDKNVEVPLSNLLDKPIGGICTSCFLEALDVVGKDKDPSWSDVFGNITQLCIEANAPQRPLCSRE